MRNTDNIFEIATRNKFRFPFKGLVSVEDLWDLSPENLDIVFKALNAAKKRDEEESLLSVRAQGDSMLDIQIEIVKYIVRVKLAERDDAMKLREKSEKRQKLLAILNEKQDADLHNKSAEELQAMLDELDG